MCDECVLCCYGNYIITWANGDPVYHIAASQDLIIAPSGDVQTKPLGANIVFTCSATDLPSDVNANLKWFDNKGVEIQLTSGRLVLVWHSKP